MEGTTMLLDHARTLSRARSRVAELADQARTFEASVAYERVLLELDAIHGDDAPALDTDATPDARDRLFGRAGAAIEEFLDHGIDALQIELLLDLLEVARGMDGP